MEIISIVYVNAVSWFLALFGILLPILLIFRAIGLTGFQEVTRFERGRSFYYRLNPATKIALGLVVTTICAITIWWIGLIVTVLLLATYANLNNGKRKLALGLYLTFATAIGSMWTLAPYTPYSILDTAFHTTVLRPIWTWPSYFGIMGYQPNLTLQGIYYGFQVATRFTAVILSALILVMTSTPSEILRTLSKLKVPIPLTFALIVAMRTIPRVFDAISISFNVQLMRGLGANANSLTRVFYYIPGAIGAIIPVMVYLLRGAKNIAISADTRAFRAFPTRTYMYDISFSRSDYTMIGIMIAGLALSLIAILLGFGRTIGYQGF
jgi:energy-coupling factor transport system permease protein